MGFCGDFSIVIEFRYNKKLFYMFLCITQFAYRKWDATQGKGAAYKGKELYLTGKGSVAKGKELYLTGKELLQMGRSCCLA